MNPSSYKFCLVSRGMNYHYYYSPPETRKPTLLFLHGFPASSYDWHRQIAYFQPKGYGMLAPDLLGYGKTSKPIECSAFQMNHMATDIIDILNAENLDRVVGVGHDWGCVLLSRLSMLHHERFVGFVWLGLPFVAPYTEPFELDAVMQKIKAMLGYEGYSYWAFFRQEGAVDDIQNNIESFMQLIFPKHPSSWLTYIALPGKTEEWVRGNMQPGRPEYLTDFEFNKVSKDFLDTGIRSPLNWYMAQLENIDLQDNLEIARENYMIKHPSFFAAALNDCLATPQMGKMAMETFGSGVTTVEFNTGHWVHLESSEALNDSVDEWLGSL